MTMKSSYWTITAGLTLIVIAYCGLMLTGTPSLISPFPTLTVLAAFVLPGAFPWLPVLVPSFFFFAWGPFLFHGKDKIPQRSLLLLTILTLLTVFDFAVEWRDGLRYQGTQFTYGTSAANGAWLFLLWLAFVRGWRKPLFLNNLLAHWLLFAWLGWYAFPYLGELP